jgi:hypothetical protein
MEEIWDNVEENGIPVGGKISPFVHRTGASCVSLISYKPKPLADESLQGEAMTLYMYFQDHPKAAEKYNANPTPDSSPIKGGRIVTVRNTKYSTMVKKKKPTEAAKSTLPYEEIVRFDPCATDEVAKDKPYELGCAQLTAQFGLDAVEELKDPHDGFNDKLSLPKDKEEMSTAHLPLLC